ncbi:MAG: AMP-binding protein [Flavobacteriaceae bacterium]
MTALSSIKKIHQRFKLNGTSYNDGQLKELAYSFIKEGQAYEQEIGAFMLDWLDQRDTIAVKTSGSTGTPKKILLRKQHMINSARATADFFGLKAGSSALLCLPAQYIAGKMMLVRAFVSGLELDCVVPSATPLAATQKIYDFCAMVPLQLENSLHNIEKLKKLLVGGAPMALQLKNQVQLSSTQIYETYGMTETITHVAVNHINSKKTLGPSGVESIFTALPNVHFEKDNRDCLVITAPKVSENPVITNDIVNLISETQFEWLGRIDNVINSGGIKLFPEQIEAKLSELISNRFFVIGLFDKNLGQKLVLIVEGKINIELLTKEIAALSSLGEYEVPKTIYNLPKFLETETGKILRNENLQLIKS